MSKRQWLCLLGAWVIVFLFAGFPADWYKIIAVITGILIIGISYNLPHERKSNSNSSSSVFTENDNQNTNA